MDEPDGDNSDYGNRNMHLRFSVVTPDSSHHPQSRSVNFWSRFFLRALGL